MKIVTPTLITILLFIQGCVKESTHTENKPTISISQIEKSCIVDAKEVDFLGKVYIGTFQKSGVQTIEEFLDESVASAWCQKLLSENH